MITYPLPDVSKLQETGTFNRFEKGKQTVVETFQDFSDPRDLSYHVDWITGEYKVFQSGEEVQAWTK